MNSQHDRRSAALAALLIALVLCSEARASAGRRGLTGDLRISVGLASVSYDQSKAPIADFEAAVFAGGLRFGSFVSRHLALGTELSAARGAIVGPLRVRDPDAFDAEPLSNVIYGYVAPLGVFIELYPRRRSGFFLSGSSGVGMMKLPTFAPAAEGGTMARYAFELGHEGFRDGKGGAWGVYLRLEHWRGIEAGVAERPNGIVSNQLFLGFRWGAPSREH